MLLLRQQDEMVKERIKVDENKESWVPFAWFCPNCGTKLTGYKNAEGVIKVECVTCHTVSVRRIMNRRHNRIDLYAPEGQETITG